MIQFISLFILWNCLFDISSANYAFERVLVSSNNEAMTQKQLESQVLADSQIIGISCKLKPVQFRQIDRSIEFHADEKPELPDINDHDVMQKKNSNENKPKTKTPSKPQEKEKQEKIEETMQERSKQKQMESQDQTEPQSEDKTQKSEKSQIETQNEEAKNHKLEKNKENNPSFDNFKDVDNTHITKIIIIFVMLAVIGVVAYSLKISMKRDKNQLQPVNPNDLDEQLT